MSAVMERADSTPAEVAGLLNVTSDRVKKIMGAYLLGSTLYKGAKTLWTKLTSELAHSVTVDSRDDLYPDVMAWLYDSIPEDRRRTVRATSNTGSSMVSPEGLDSTEPPAKLRLHYHGSRSQTVTLDGHRVKVEVDSENDPGRDGDGGYRLKIERVTFTARDVAGRNAVLRFLESAAAARVRTGPRLYIASRWGDWLRAGGVPVRRFDTVALPSGIEADLIGDLATFFAQEDDYVRLGLPWHRGYVFHGPPGGGKTTVAKALASRFDLDVYFVPLSDIEDDTGLMRMFAQLPPRSLLLLEDIDIAAAARDRDDQGKGVSMSALLQSLDGIVTPSGLVTVMTTNQLSALDPALIRPGRADRIFEIGYLDHPQLVDLVRVLTGQEIDVPDPAGLDLTPAAVIEVLKHHLDDMAAGARAVVDHVVAVALGSIEAELGRGPA